MSAEWCRTDGVRRGAVVGFVSDFGADTPNGNIFAYMYVCLVIDRVYFRF